MDLSQPDRPALATTARAADPAVDGAVVAPWRPIPAWSGGSPGRAHRAAARLAPHGAAVALGLAGPVARAVGEGRTGLVVGLLVVGCALGLASLVPDGGRGTACRVGVGVLAVLVAPSGARADVLVAVAGASVARAGLVGWMPVAGWPARTVRAVGLAVVPTAAGAVAWWRGSSVAVPLAADVLALAVVELHHRVPALAARADAALRRALVALGAAVGAVVVLVVATVLLYLPGLVARPFRRLGRGRAVWVPHPGPAPPAHDGRLHAAVDPARRRRGNAIGVAVALVVLVAGIALARDDRGADDTAVELRSAVAFSDLPSYAGVPFADALQAEQRRFAEALPADPVTVVGSGTFAGRYTHVTDGVRRTVPSTCVGCPRASVWLVGGSVAFGLGQRDQGTVASALVRRAADDGIALEVTNLAVPGWTSWQEAAAVRARLAAGAAPPDLVVGIGGFNDTVAAAATTALGLPDDDPLLLEPEAVLRFERERLPIPAGGGPGPARRRAVRAVEAGRAEMARLAGEAGASTFTFFHPDALADADQLRPVRDVTRGVAASRADELGRLLSGVAADLHPGTVDLRDLYDDAPPVFVDWAHTNEEGAALLAAAVFVQLRPALVAAAAAP